MLIEGVASYKVNKAPIEAVWYSNVGNIENVDISIDLEQKKFVYYRLRFFAH